MTVLNDPRDAFDAALIPGMRQRLAEGYARFRAAEAKAVAQLATPEAGGVKGAYRDRHCPNCGAAAPTQTLLRAHGIGLVSCPDCDLTYSRQVMDEAADAARYRASDLDIEAMQLRCSGPYLELETARARYYLDRLGETMTRTGTMCEIGCGTGVFLAEAAIRGWDALGIEPGSAAAAVARGRARQVVEGYFPQDLPDGRHSFDAVAMLDVLEHFANPHGFLRIVRDHLAPGGRLFVQVPNWDSLLVQLEGAGSSVVCPGHWSYFTPRSLPDLMARAGYRAVLVETVVSEVDRIAQFSAHARQAALARLRPNQASHGEMDHDAALSAAWLRKLGLAYKLIGIFEPER